MRSRLPLLALLAVVPFLGAAHAARVHTQAAALGEGEVEVDVYVPDGPSRGVAIVAHGFTRDRSRHRDLGRALAEAGVTAVVPDVPEVGNPWHSGDALAEFALNLERGTLGLPLAPTARSSIVLVGTSAGGLATLIAASKLPGLGGWVGLDPVDGTGSGATAAARLRAPAIVMLAEPSRCNLMGSGRAIASAAPTLVRADYFPGASHCDFESPTSRFCEVVCGKSRPGAADLARDAAVAAVIELLAKAPGSALPRTDASPAAPARR